jgi:hypothetical protein
LTVVDANSGVDRLKRARVRVREILDDTTAMKRPNL